MISRRRRGRVDMGCLGLDGRCTGTSSASFDDQADILMSVRLHLGVTSLAGSVTVPGSARHLGHVSAMKWPGRHVETGNTHIRKTCRIVRSG